MRILVLGATGNVGRAVVAAALAAGHEVRAVSRGGGDLPEGADGYVGDLDDASTLTRAVDGVESVFTLAGYGGLAETLTDAGRAGVRRVVLLSSSSAPSGKRDNAVAKYHLESEDSVRASGLEWTILQPNAFMSNALRWRPQILAGEVIREPFGDVALSVVDPADIAGVALLALTSADHHGRYYRLSGPEALTAAERAEILGAALGRALTVEVPSDEEAREGVPPAYADAFHEFYRGGLIDETTVHPTVEQLLGRPPAAFADWAAANSHRFAE
ncbi:NAD(P)H-binding protein [Paractinoplanes lichenicola]|uniref:NAD(P)H-binding protein n=1 Tax=Paractinoplanes lichenicola TaxID=2802976 RepID=A0ABS1VET1_9ACTN|nr:NAD(P)H-binding protein [Actinoplanes lichenicola]MBL7252810.1 NAD(P)H-binding protein [Actinoplanes lichenicola]